MELIIIPVLYGVVIVNIILSLIIFLRGLTKKFNVFFGLMSLTVAIWSFAIIGFYSDSLRYLFNWIALSHFSAMFSAVLLCFFSVYFPTLNVNIFNRIKYIIPIIFLTTCYLIFKSDLIVGQPSYDNFSYVINSGYLYYQLFLILFFIISYITLYIQYKSSQDIEVKQQLKYIFIGALCASFFGSITNLIFPVINIFDFTWLGPIFTLILVASIFIAILRYHLFNIKLIITELFAILIIVMLLVDLFLEKNSALLTIKAVVLAVVAIFAYFLIKSVYQEVALREQVQKLAKGLEKSNSDLELANNKLKELDQLKSEFLSLATHQIRAPLTAIKGYASLVLEGDYGQISPQVEGAVKNIFESCQNLVLIVGDFLDISRIEQGRMKYEMVDFDIILVTKDIIEKLRPNIESSGLTISFESIVDKQIVCLDQNKIRQVVGNIIDNSIKYTKEGGIKVSISIEDPFIKISVKDTGIGISKDDIPKLFAKFVRAKDASKTNVIGTGLGLYIAKQMVEAQGGRVYVQSEGLGKGSDFIIMLPIKK